MKMRVTGVLMTILLGISITSPLYAIDEDYFIPYTDNYGYEYDPETGTYVKKDDPAPVATNNQPSTHTTDNNNSAAQQSLPTTSPTPAVNEETPFRLPLILAAVIVILGIASVIARTQKKRN